MQDLTRTLIGRFFTPPPMPAEAMPKHIKFVPGAAAAMSQAWESMFYAALGQGIAIGSVAILAVIVAVMLRMNVANISKEIINAQR